MPDKEHYSWGDDYKWTNDPVFWVFVFVVIAIIITAL